MQVLLLSFYVTTHSLCPYLYVFSCIHFSNMAISPQNNEKKEKCFIPVNYMGWLHPVCCKREVFGYKETDNHTGWLGIKSPTYLPVCDSK